MRKQLLQQKIQQLGDEESMSHDRNPSLPSRHDKWKRDLQRPNGDYTSDASRLVAEKIVSQICCMCMLCVI